MAKTLLDILENDLIDDIELINLSLNNIYINELNNIDSGGHPNYWTIFENNEFPERYLRKILPYCDINFVVETNNNHYNLLYWLIMGSRENRAIFLIENSNIDINIIATYHNPVYIYAEDDEFTDDDVNITPLIKSCENRLYRCVKSLIMNGADVNYINDTNGNSVVYALINDINAEGFDYIIYPLLRLIIDRADISFLNHSYEDSLTLLNFYVTPFREEEILLLLERGINVNDVKFIEDLCSEGYTEIFFKVIDNVNPNIYDPPPGEYGTSPLLEALTNYHFDIADKLLDLGTNVNFYVDHGLSILIYVLQGSDIGLTSDAVDRLLLHNVDLNFTEGYQRTAIFFVNTVDILNKLVLHGANINHEDSKQHSILYYAIRQYRYDLVQAILNFGPDTSKAFDDSLILTENYKLHVFDYMHISPPKYTRETLPENIYYCLLFISRNIILSLFGIDVTWNLQFL